MVEEWGTYPTRQVAVAIVALLLDDSIQACPRAYITEHVAAQFGWEGVQYVRADGTSGGAIVGRRVSYALRDLEREGIAVRDGAFVRLVGDAHLWLREQRRAMLEELLELPEQAPP